VYVVLLKRNASAKGRKVFICLAALIGIVLSFVSGLGYAVIDARYSWHTPLLPLGYLSTSIPTGLAAYLVVVLAGKDENQSVGHLYRGVMVGGIIAAIVAALYAIVSGTATDLPLVIWGLVVVVGGIVPACIGGLLAKKPEGAFGKSVCALVCALVGSVAFRCFMWATSTVVANLFLQL
jgi:formate-dependent nitrite reductase membrane component NrfD